MDFEKISHGGRDLALIVYNSYRTDGVRFFTGNELSQQLAYMHHPAGKTIAPHVHRPVSREVFYTQEVLVIKTGRLRVDFYDDDRRHIAERELAAGDVILLMSGGHGFEVLEELEMFEIKQGPYAGDQDKQVFTPATPRQ